MVIRPALAYSLLTSALLLAASSAARADAIEMGVMERARPDYDAKGLPLGGFRLYPTLELGVSADDNVYRTRNARADDVFFTIAPNVDLRSDWTNNLVEITAGIKHYRYAREDSENRTDWNVGGRTRLDVLRGTTVSAEIHYASLHEPRTSPDQPGLAITPTKFSVLHTRSEFTHAPGRVGVTLGGTYDRLDYRPTPLFGGGTMNNRDRDHAFYRLDAKLFFNVSDHYGVFVRGSYHRRSFDLNLDRNGFDRGSHGYSLGGGVDLRVTNLLRGEIFAGYVKERFHAPLPDIDGVDFGARLTWYADALYTLHFTAQRQFNPTTIFGAAVSDDRIFRLGVDYELLRNLIVQGAVDYTDSHFTGAGRSDTIWGASLKADYLLNRNMRAYLGYSFSRRNSSAVNEDFRDNIVSAGLKLAL